jgi:hypothetical protein
VARGGVVLVTSIKLYHSKILPDNSRFPTSFDQSKKWPCAQLINASAKNFSFTSSFHLFS